MIKKLQLFNLLDSTQGCLITAVYCDEQIPVKISNVKMFIIKDGIVYKETQLEHLQEVYIIEHFARFLTENKNN